VIKNFLKPNLYRSEVLMVNDKLKLTLDNSRNIFSLNENKDETNKFNRIFKKFFGFSVPEITKFKLNDNSIVLWSRTKSYIILSDFNLDDLTSTFDDLASITDQTGGWLTFKISGKGSIHLFEKLVTINLENFNEGNVIRTSISKINCFVLCKEKAQTYYIICPVSFSNSMRSRLIQLIELS
jgi:heterotetrameric sarcosine oxidase gamma subunit